MLNYITNLLTHYGYIVLFTVLTVELIALPTPGETLLTYCGFLVSQGRLSWLFCILVASSGVITGVTISYTIGRTIGLAFFKRFGKYIHLGPERLDKMSKWFSHYGDRFLFITYFVPGVRHVTGHFSGIMGIPYKKFALKAYTGAFLWTSTFVSLGKVLGSHYKSLHVYIRKYLVIAVIIIAAVFVITYLYRNHKREISAFIYRFLYYLDSIVHSKGKIKVVIFGAAFIITALFIVVFWLADNFLENDLIRFDRIGEILEHLIFTGVWSYFMELIGLFASIWGLVFVFVLVFLWILRKGSSRMLEISSCLIALIGGVAVSYGLVQLFNHLAVLSSYLSGYVRYKFPSQQSMMVAVFYGYGAFIVIRHSKLSLSRTFTGITAFIICFLTGLSLIYMHQHPSDVIAGYAFGGIWLSINIILLEIFRILPKFKPESINLRK